LKMSSNNNHIIPVLTRANYEEYFLLYVDEELTPEAKHAVEAFAALHPDLKEELDLLCSTKLPSDDLCFFNKEDLLADSMKVQAIDENLLLYIDNELPAAAAAALETRLKADAGLALQHALLQKTKLDKNEVVPYPNKKELYRHTERRLVPVWLRVAAAVVLLAGAGTAAWLTMNGSNNAGPGVAVATPKTTVPQPATPVVTNAQNHVAAEENNHTTATAHRTGTKEKTLPEANTLAAAPRTATGTKRSTFSKPHAAPANTLATNKLPVSERTVAVVNTGDAEKIKPVLKNLDVTSETPPAYVTIDATAKTTVPVNAVATEDAPEKSGGSVRGFLRKATRVIERRTGIKTVNDDDELLVGAVALKLK
jgi:hypothetical protein